MSISCLLKKKPKTIKTKQNETTELPYVCKAIKSYCKMCSEYCLKIKTRQETRNLVCFINCVTMVGNVHGDVCPSGSGGGLAGLGRGAQSAGLLARARIAVWKQGELSVVKYTMLRSGKK